MTPFIPNKDDRELDELFRKAAAAHVSEQAGREGDAGRGAVWDKLTAQLNAAGKASRHRHLSRKWIMCLVLLTIALTGFFIWQNAKPGNRERRTAALQKEKRVDHLLRAITKRDKNKADEFEYSKVNNRAEKQESGSSFPLIKHPIPSGKSGSQDYLQTQPGSKMILAEGKGKTGADDYKTAVGILHPLSSLPFSSLRKERKFVLPENISVKRLNDTPKMGKQTDVIASEMDVKNDEPQGAFSHWSLGLSAGPDWSGVKTKGWRMGITGGLKLTYHFSPKWAISSGLFLSKILYDTAPDEYHPEDNGWQNYNVKQIRAKCIVWDVPLNVEYSLWNRRGNNIFLSTGLSSFWMQEEQYTYRYKTQTGSLKQWTKELYNQNHHLFSILNFSAGYQKDWRRLSLQVAPYLKIPLKGIGYGRVKLYGAGVHFTLQYGLK